MKLKKASRLLKLLAYAFRSNKTWPSRGSGGGVTRSLVSEVRKRLDQERIPFRRDASFPGGLLPRQDQGAGRAGADSFGVGSFISGASAIDMTMDIKEVAEPSP